MSFRTVNVRRVCDSRKTIRYHAVEEKKNNRKFVYTQTSVGSSIEIRHLSSVREFVKTLRHGDGENVPKPKETRKNKEGKKTYAETSAYRESDLVCGPNGGRVALYRFVSASPSRGFLRQSTSQIGVDVSRLTRHARLCFLNAQQRPCGPRRNET